MSLVTSVELANIRSAAHALGITTGRSTERERIKAILHAEAARDRVEMARHLAFETDMAPAAAVALLAKSPESSPTDTHANALARAIAAYQVGRSDDDKGIVNEPDDEVQR